MCTQKATSPSDSGASTVKGRNNPNLKKPYSFSRAYGTLEISSANETPDQGRRKEKEVALTHLVEAPGLINQDRTLFTDIDQELLNNGFSFLQVHERHALVGKMCLILDVIPRQAASVQSNTGKLTEL